MKAVSARLFRLRTDPRLEAQLRAVVLGRLAKRKARVPNYHRRWERWMAQGEARLGKLERLRFRALHQVFEGQGPETRANLVRFVVGAARVAQRALRSVETRLRRGKGNPA